MVTGLVIYWLVVKAGLPALASHASEAQIEWLRQRFRTHSMEVLAAVGGLAVILALPLLGVFRLVYGPLRVLREHPVSHSARQDRVDGVDRLGSSRPKR